MPSREEHEVSFFEDERLAAVVDLQATASAHHAMLMNPRSVEVVVEGVQEPLERKRRRADPGRLEERRSRRDGPPVVRRRIPDDRTDAVRHRTASTHARTARGRSLRRSDWRHSRRPSGRRRMVAKGSFGEALPERKSP